MTKITTGRTFTTAIIGRSGVGVITEAEISGIRAVKISMLRLMRNAGQHERVARVNSRSFATLTLDFDLDADPVAGVVRTGADRGEPFAGWLALTRAIERTLDDARAAAVSSATLVDGRTSTSDPSRSQP